MTPSPNVSATPARQAAAALSTAVEHVDVVEQCQAELEHLYTIPDPERPRGAVGAAHHTLGVSLKLAETFATIALAHELAAIRHQLGRQSETLGRDLGELAQQVKRA